MASLEIIDNLEKSKLIDKEDMLGIAGSMPEMLRQAYEASRRVKLEKIRPPRNIVICGMGGSAMAGSVILDLIGSISPVPISVSRNYSLPAAVDKNSLLIALSYSGNTEETLAAVKEGLARKCKIICITADGKLKELAAENDLPIFIVAGGYQPRAALVLILSPLLVIMEKLGYLGELKESIEESIALLEKLRKEYSVENPLRTNPVKQLAKKLVAAVPVILATTGVTEACGLRLKTQLNENGKVTALLSLFPELNHNELVNLGALQKTKHNFALLVLRDEAESDRMKKRIEITKSLIGIQMGGINELAALGKSRLTRILSLVYFGDLLTVYLAILRGADPTPVAVITRLKKEMGR